MVLEMNVLNGIFYKSKIFQSKYYWIEIKYLGAIQNRRDQHFFLRGNAFSQYKPAFASAIITFRHELGRLYIFQYIFKYLCKYWKYSDLNSFTQNA